MLAHFEPQTPAPELTLVAIQPPKLMNSEILSAIEPAFNSIDDLLSEAIRKRVTTDNDNKFFQGFSELSVAYLLSKSGWTVRSLSLSNGMLSALRPNGSPINILVRGFIQSHSPKIDEATALALEASLMRVHTSRRFSVFVRRLLPADFDPEPVRQAVQLWLGQVARDEWDGEFATYEDEGVTLEFCLNPRKLAGDRSPLQMVLGPFLAGRSVRVLEHRAVQALDRYFASEFAGEPVMVAGVANRPWGLSCGYVRELFYGKPRWVESGDDWRACLSKMKDPCLYKDALFHKVSGTMLLERDERDGLLLSGRTFSNPHAREPLLPTEMPVRTYHSVDSDDHGRAIMGWSPRLSEGIRLGG